MVIEHTDPFAPAAKPDPALIKAIGKAHRFNEMLLHARVSKFADLAKGETCTDPITARSFASLTSPPTLSPPSSMAVSLPV